MFHEGVNGVIESLEQKKAKPERMFSYSISKRKKNILCNCSECFLTKAENSAENIVTQNDNNKNVMTLLQHRQSVIVILAPV